MYVLYMIKFFFSAHFSFLRLDYLLGPFKITSNFKERTSNTLSVSYSLDSCALAKLLLFESIDEDNIQHNHIDYNTTQGYLRVKNI